MLDIKSVSDNVATILRVLTPKLTIAFAIAAWLLLLINARGWMPLPQGIVVSALVVGIFSTCLVFTSLIAWLWKVVRPVREAIVRAAFLRGEKIRIERELAFLTPEERHIIAYLLAKKQKMFEVQPDGEKAAMLISKGFLVIAQKGPPLIHRDMIVTVPDHVWDLLVEHGAEFRYAAPPTDKEKQPWRISWMVR